MPSVNHTHQQFNQIVQSHSAILFASVIRITNNQQTTEDIVQDTFLRLWENRLSLKNDNIGGWLYRVAVNLAYKHLRSESCKTRIHTSLQTAYQQACNEVEDRIIQKENTVFFTKVYNRLPEQQQAVYLLSNDEGLSRNEIAAHLNISPNTVKNHLSRAVRFLREHIKYASVFLLFVILNYIFFKTGSTKSDPVDLLKVQERNKKAFIDQRYINSLHISCTGTFTPVVIKEKNI